MTITLGLNLYSLRAQRDLAGSSEALSGAFQRLSSGQRINKASDDAAGLAIAETLNSSTRVYSQGIKNLNDGTSLLNIADSTVEEMTNIVTRIRELATQAANGSYSSKQRAALDAEAQQLTKEYSRIIKTTSFNGLNIFDGSVSDVNFQGGFGDSGSIGGYVSGQMGNGGFTTRSTATLAATTGGIAIGDLNGDGMPDLVTANATVTYVALGNGDGTLSAATSYATTASSVVITDLNNDGIADLVSSGANKLQIQIGIGDGTFNPVKSIAVTGAQKGLAAGDFNNDGIIDLAMAGAVVIGNGNGTFGAAISFASLGAGSVVVGDLNSDGNLDVVRSDGLTSILVALGNGDGRFSAGVSYAADGASANNIKLGDLNGDGVLDVVTTGYGASASEVTIRLGNANGTFGALVSFSTLNDRDSFDVMLADANGDGALDIFSGGRHGGLGGVTYLSIGNGDGTFTAQRTVSSIVGAVNAIAAADMNADGVLDLVSVNNGAAVVKTGNTRSGTAPLLAFSLKTMLDAKSTMSQMDQKLVQLTQQVSSIGALQSRLNSALRTLGNTTDNYAAAEGRIMDIDVASEAADVTRQRVLTQAATAVLANANQQPSITLSLLK